MGLENAIIDKKDICKKSDNPPTNTQTKLEYYSRSRQQYKERVQMIENSSRRKFEAYHNAKNLLTDFPNQSTFIQYKGNFYQKNSDIPTGKPDNFLPNNNMRLECGENGQIYIEYAKSVLKKELQEFIQQYEKEQKELQTIDNLLKNNTNTQTFYELDGNYYTTNPTRTITNNNQLFDVLRVKEVSRNDLEIKIDSAEKGSIEGISKKLDYIIDNLKPKNPDEIGRNENLRKFLIELRVGISLNDNNSNLSLLTGESLGNLIHLLEKSQNQTLSINEIGSIIGYTLNIARMLGSDITSLGVSLIKDFTSSRLFKFGKEESEVEKEIRISIESGNISNAISILNYITSNPTLGENLKTMSKDIANVYLGSSAGGIDALLDYIQSGVDIVIAPDKILQNFGDIYNNGLDKNKEIFKELINSFENPGDYAYVLSYIITIIACFYIIPGKHSIFGIIKKGLIASGLIPQKSIPLLEKTLSNENIQAIARNSGITDKFKDGTKKASELGKGALDYGDSSLTLRKGLEKTSELLGPSEKALQLSGNSIRLAQIFGDKFQEVVSDNVSTKKAMDAYKEVILKGEGFKISDVDALIESTSGEVKYNLIRVREKLIEIEKVMETEIMPVVKKYIDYTNTTDNINIQLLKRDINKNLDKYNTLSRLILKEHILRK